MRNLVAALFRLEHSRGPDAVCEVLATLSKWLAEPEQTELRRAFLLWLREGFLKARLPSERSSAITSGNALGAALGANPHCRLGM